MVADYTRTAGTLYGISREFGQMILRAEGSSVVQWLALSPCSGAVFSQGLSVWRLQVGSASFRISNLFGGLFGNFKPSYPLSAVVGFSPLHTCVG